MKIARFVFSVSECWCIYVVRLINLFTPSIPRPRPQRYTRGCLLERVRSANVHEICAIYSRNGLKSLTCQSHVIINTHEKKKKITFGIM